MKLIKPSFGIWDQPVGLEGVYKQIEKVGRVCYKSEDKITEDSAKGFVDRMVKSGHGAMLEHGTVYLKIPFGKMLDNGEFENEALAHWFVDNPYSWVKTGGVGTEDCWYVTSNYRVLIEKDLLHTLQYLCEPTEFHEKRITVHFVCDRGVSHEYVRHRVFSFAQESTRYCNYSKDKFGNELTFIIPCWCDDIPNNTQLKDKIEVGRFVWGVDNLVNVVVRDGAVKRRVSKFTQRFLYEMVEVEDTYIGLIAAEYKPQEARAVLPNALNTELVMTGFVSDWNHFFDLRARGTTGAPHPQAKELAEPLMKEFIARKYINN